MRYIQLGGSDLEVSRICLGGNSWGAQGRRAWAPFGPDESAGFFKAARDVGINFFDTAEGYNEGESERIIGSRLIGEHPRSELVICTKAVPQASAGGVRQHIVRAVEGSLGRLKTDYIDVFCLHRLDPALPVEEALAGLEDVVSSGKVRYVGASTMRPSQLARIVTLAKRSGVARFVAMQNLHNLLYREDEHDMNLFCAEENISTFPYSPLARGMLSGSRLDSSSLTERAQSDGYAEYYKRENNRPIIERVVEIAAARGVKPTQVALAWLLTKPAVAAPVIGATRHEHLVDAARATELEVTADEITRLEEKYTTVTPIFT
ncbi:MAG TPA: aldo/keto reductase [Geminicoccaceae bacterium]|nr:aldo/keto reductase [Geminicoccus sp.]HMU51808.1 aldo/keto reductase [Geminicoccaceae bacterium]